LPRGRAVRHVRRRLVRAGVAGPRHPGHTALSQSMKIKHVEAIPLARQLEDVFHGGTYKITSRNTIVTRVELDNGVEGETFGGDEDQYQVEVCRLVNELYRPLLLGTDVRDMESHWERMWNTRID